MGCYLGKSRMAPALSFSCNLPKILESVDGCGIAIMGYDKDGK